MVCRLDPATVQQYLINPTGTASFLNPVWTEPTPGQDLYTPSAWSIRIYYGTVAYQFGYYYNGLVQPMKINEQSGGRNTSTWAISDYRDESPLLLPVLPFIPIAEMNFAIFNWPDESYCYQRGSLKRVQKRPLGQRADGTLKNDYIITAVGLWAELDRRPVKEIYVNKTVGFQLKDVLTRYTSLDASAIDATLGITVSRKSWENQTPEQVLQWANNTMGFTAWIDDSTRKIYWGPKNAKTHVLPYTWVDGDVYEWFDFQSFDIHRDSSLIQNSLILKYNKIYGDATGSAGMVSVVQSPAALSDKVVRIFPPGPVPTFNDWEGFNSANDLKIQIGPSIGVADGATYTIQKNNSTGATWEFQLSNQYKEASSPPGVGLPYQMIIPNSTAYAVDSKSLLTMQSIKGDDGVFSFVVSEESNAFTPDEAQQYAQALLAQSQPLPSGGCESTNDVLNFLPLHTGMIMAFDLVTTQDFQGSLEIMNLEIEDMGGALEPSESFDGKPHPCVKITIGFDAALNDEQVQQRSILQQKGRRTVSLSDQNDFDFNQNMQEVRASLDCLETAENIAEMTTYIDFMNFWDDYWYGFIT